MKEKAHNRCRISSDSEIIRQSVKDMVCAEYKRIAQCHAAENIDIRTDEGC